MLFLALNLIHNFFDTQDGGEKRAVRARDGSIITFSVCLVPWSSRVLMVDFSFRLIRWLFFSFLLGNHKGFQVLCVDHSSVNLEFPEGIINFGAGELLTPCHQ